MNIRSRSVRVSGVLALLASAAWTTDGSALTSFHLWSQRFGGIGAENTRGATADATGNVFLIGQYRDTSNFGGGVFSSNGFYDIFLAKYDANGTHLWSKSFGAGQNDIGYALATDPAGNVYVTGAFRNIVNFGGSNLTSAGSNDDIFLAKYNASGVHQWSQRFGSTGIDIGYGVAVDGSGTVYLTGRFNDTVTFGGGIPGLPSTGSDDAFLARYDTNGLFVWATTFGSTASDWAQGATVDEFGNIIITGIFNGDISNMDGPTLTHMGGGDAFLAKFNSGAVLQWSKAIGSAGLEQGYSVATDGSSSVFMAGAFSSTVNLGGGALTSAGETDVVLVKYNASGAHLWSKRFGGTLSDGPYSLAVDGSGNAVIAGFFQNTADFGNGNITSAGGLDGFVAKYLPGGAPTWSRGLGGASTDVAYGVAVGPTGSAYVSGGFMGTVNFGGANFTAFSGSEDIFFAKYSAESVEPLISSITDIGNDQGRQVKVTFERSSQDDPVSVLPVIRYEAYRRSDAPPALLSRDPTGLPPRELLSEGWTQVGSIDGHGELVYSMDVPTIGDSTNALGQYHSVFFVRGATSNSFTFYDSPADSGYSLDNLAPGVPLNFVYDAGGLSWNESAAADFDFFTVYGSNVDAFGSATVVDYSIANAMDVSASPYVYYYVTATDFSGNEGKPAKVNTLSNVGGTPKNYVLSVSNYPNPFNPRTTVRYTTPSPGEVKVHIYDARGAIVKTLFEGHRVAGAYSIDWDGRADNGDAVASGLYFARIEHASGTRSKKMVLLK